MKLAKCNWDFDILYAIRKFQGRVCVYGYFHCGFDIPAVLNSAEYYI